MLNPLLDKYDNEQTNNGEQKKTDETYNDCSWCIFCDFECLIKCCLG